MAIELLSPRLANQIAAGEVVERPSSVVKELIENSLDAGATQIVVDIEKGGSKLIRIRDNGFGVDKSELILALSRHATSKISNLDDLEAIVSLGFRGEALASISSVSRLHFTSKTAQQTEAWQAFAQGRDMEVTITPAAHPVGTSVEVADLFFNTPARRRFLRTEKTEFNHIEELLRRFALSRFDVEFSLKHNGKVLRHLKVANSKPQQERRVAAICGVRFMENAIAISNEHNGIVLSGWLGLPAACKAISDVAYCYVNGRMMRDKLINHAIRQAYQHFLPEGCQPSYVLYIVLDPAQVDVNVHPSKHEVRFHQARMIHDLITQVLGSGLSQAMAQIPGQLNEVPAAPTHHYNNQGLVNSHQVQDSPEHMQTAQPPVQFSDLAQTPQVGSSGQSAGYANAGNYSATPSNVRQASQSYSQLINPNFSGAQSFIDTPSNAKIASDAGFVSALFGQPLSLVDKSFLLLQRDKNIELLSLDKLHQRVTTQELLARWAQGFAAQPLLLPVSITLDSTLVEQLVTYKQLFRRLGIDISVRDPQIIIKQVPQMLREQDVALLVPQLIQLLHQQQHSSDDELKEVVCQWLAKLVPKQYALAQAISLLQKAQEFSGAISEHVNDMRSVVDFSATINLLQTT
ncbi:MAG: DNA mismatch repair endonuclease MutL [Psychrobium sp.]|nr:DNA mismatch repair endonuclease MutL [Psychrobium sp.]